MLISNVHLREFSLIIRKYLATETTDKLKSLRDEIKSGTRIISLSGLTSIASKAFILSKLQTETDKTFVVVADSNKELETWECDLEFWIQPSNVSSQVRRKSAEIRNPTIILDAAFDGIRRLRRNFAARRNFGKTRAGALEFVLQPTGFYRNFGKIFDHKNAFARRNRENSARFLKRDEDFPPEELIEKLAASGYVREEPIKNIGEFSVRGGIIDVWSPDAENPVRIEFFGDTVDSIREFDAETQLSTDQ